jgi:NADH dehydrogenase
VVIVGAGFGGLWAARALRNAPADVTLIDRNNYHTFFPLLYQVAAAELEPEDIACPVRSILRHARNLRFVMAEVQGLDLAARLVRTDQGEHTYDYLIIATGSRPLFFGVPGAAEHALRLRSLEEGVALRNHILFCFERASVERDDGQRQRLLNFAIVGGGPTGVEFAGALAELVHGPLRKDFRGLDVRQVSIVLVEAAESLLSVLAPRLRAYAVRRLQRMGVQVRLGVAVERIGPEGVRLKDGELLPAATVVWTAGVGGDAARFLGDSELAPASRGSAPAPGPAARRDGRVPVQPTLQLAGRPEIYVIGDCAYLEHEGKPLPMVAPAAIQQGVAAARNIRRQLAGQEPLPFRYHDPGTLAVIGRNAAAAHVFGRDFTGYPAWLLWLAIHLARLIGFRNRIMALTSWAWDYLFLERVVRLILPRATPPG